MRVTNLKVNGIDVELKDQPIGLEDSSILFTRDSKFRGFNIETNIELKFYCASGKYEIDEEFNERGEDGIAEITLFDECNGEEIQIIFLLDFSKYKTNSSYTKVGLIEKNDTNEFKENLNNSLEIPTSSAKDVYVRNIPIDYNYYSERAEMKDVVQNGRTDLICKPLSPAIDWFYIFPKSYTTVNELEDGSELLANQILTDISTTQETIYSDNIGTPFVISSQKVSEIEPSPIFENTLEDGLIELTTAGNNGIELSIYDSNYAFQYARFRENIVIGNDFNNPRIHMNCHLFAGTTAVITNLGAPANYFNVFHTGTHTEDYHNTYNTLTSKSLDVKKGEKVWIYYSWVSGSYSPPSPITVNGTVFSTGTTLRFINYKRMEILIGRSISIKYRTNQKTTIGDITNDSDIENYSTKIKAWHGNDIVSVLYPNMGETLFDSDCYKDMYFSNGEYMRDKSNKKPFFIKTIDFYEQIDNVISAGIGIFYDVFGNPELKFLPIENFHDSNIGLVINDNYDDVEIEVSQNLLYNEIEQGYTLFKDVNEDLHRKNNYNIIEQKKGSSLFTKVSDFIASKYLFKRAFSKGTDDNEQEFDNSIFLISAIDNGTNYIHTYSQNSNSSALGFDDVFETNGSNIFGLNRRYATVFNLVRSKLRWFTGLFKDKTILNNNSIYTKTVEGGSSLALCDLERTLNASSTEDSDNIGSISILPIIATINVAMSMAEFYAIRKVWYKTIQINKPSETIYLTADSFEYNKGVVKIKGLKRLI